MIREGRKIAADSAERIPEMVELVSADSDVIALFAFGGLAKGQLKPLSDLDIAVLISRRLTGSQRFEKHLKLLTTLNRLFRTDEVDLVLLNNSSPRFAHSILRDGQILFCREFDILIDFSEFVRKNFFDFRYYRDRFDEVFLKGIGYHG